MRTLFDATVYNDIFVISTIRYLFVNFIYLSIYLLPLLNIYLFIHSSSVSIIQR